MNTALRAARVSMLMSQDELAAAIQAAALRAGDSLAVNKRTIQRWEADGSKIPRAVYARALEAVTGLPIESLGFPADADALVVDDGRGGHDLEVRAAPLKPGTVRKPQGNYSGVWLSRYEYFSSGRSDMYSSQHHVVLLQHGDRLTVRSLPGSADSSVGMDLTADGGIVTGTWVEETAANGYYRGARYHGALQMLAEPTGRRVSGKWVGFGKDFEINTGPWTLTFLDSSTSKATLAAYDRRPND